MFAWIFHHCDKDQRKKFIIEEDKASEEKEKKIAHKT